MWDVYTTCNSLTCNKHCSRDFINQAMFTSFIWLLVCALDVLDNLTENLAVWFKGLEEVRVKYLDQNYSAKYNSINCKNSTGKPLISELNSLLQCWTWLASSTVWNCRIFGTHFQHFRLHNDLWGLQEREKRHTFYLYPRKIIKLKRKSQIPVYLVIKCNISKHKEVFDNKNTRLCTNIFKL
jgi:hypothetical protein